MSSVKRPSSIREVVSLCRRPNAVSLARAPSQFAANSSAWHRSISSSTRKHIDKDNGSFQLVTSVNMSSQIASKVRYQSVASPAPCAAQLAVMRPMPALREFDS